MTQVRHSCTDDIWKREVTSIADEMLKFRKVIGETMKKDESMDDADLVQLENLKQSFAAVWRMWRTALSNREEEAYDAFIISVMKGEPGEEKKED